MKSSCKLALAKMSQLFRDLCYFVIVSKIADPGKVNFLIVDDMSFGCFATNCIISKAKMVKHSFGTAI